jgi:hypothetical protein
MIAIRTISLVGSIDVGATLEDAAANRKDVFHAVNGGCLIMRSK